MVLANCSARMLAILGLAGATIAVARVGGPADVGVYALLRMLPGLVGRALRRRAARCARLLPVRAPPEHPAAVADAARPSWPPAPRSGSPCGCWPLPLLARTFFPGDSLAVIAWAGATVVTQLVLTVGKTSLQGLQDRKGGDLVIAAEELAFLPCYLLPVLAGMHGTAGAGRRPRCWRTSRWRSRPGAGCSGAPGGGPATGSGRPRRDLGREVLTYGIRGQVGGMITLLNLRLDFAILGAMAGPAVLGAYAVASKYAELLRLPGTALTWVSYPMLAGMPAPRGATRQARRLVVPALVGEPGRGGAVRAARRAGDRAVLRRPVRLRRAAPPRCWSSGCCSAGPPGWPAATSTAAVGPGSTRSALGLGLVVTVVLDLLLIPPYGAMGAAVASTVDLPARRRRPARAAGPGQPPREPGGRRCPAAGAGADMSARPRAAAHPVPGGAGRLPGCAAGSADRIATVAPDARRQPATARPGGRATERLADPTRRPPDRGARRPATPTPSWPASCTPAAWTSGSRPTSSPAGSRVRQAFQEGLDRLGRAGRRPRRRGLQGRRRARLPATG